MQRWNHIGRFAVLPERDCHGSEWVLSALATSLPGTFQFISSQ